MSRAGGPGHTRCSCSEPRCLCFHQLDWRLSSGSQQYGRSLSEPNPITQGHDAGHAATA
jgi:hypothetical protein